MQEKNEKRVLKMSIDFYVIRPRSYLLTTS